MKHTAPLLLAGVLAAGLAAPTLAQQYKMDPNAPLDVNADTQTKFDPTDCTLNLKGKVEITRDRTRLRSQTATAYSEKERGGDCGGIVRLVAKGEVFYVTPDQKVRADNADYDVTKETAVFTGNVVAVRGQDVITSQSLVVNLETNAAESTGRFRGVFYPKSSKGQ